MNFLLQCIIIIWLSCFVPYFIGILLNCFVGRIFEKNAEIFVYGYIGIWTLFLLVAVPMIMLGMTLSMLSTVWLVTCGGISILTIIFFRKDISAYGKKIIEEWKTKGTFGKCVWLVIILLTVLSIVFVKGNGTGDVVEHAMRAVSTDSLYMYDAYSGLIRTTIPNELRLAPFDMYFAVLSYVTNVHPAIMIKMICPLILIPVIYLGYQMWGAFLFARDEKRESIFLLIMIIINLWPILSGKGSGFLIYSGIWQRDTMIYSFVLPVTLLACMKEWQLNRKMILLFICCAGAAELVFYKGVLFTVLIMGISTIIILCRRWKNAGYFNRH